MPVPDGNKQGVAVVRVGSPPEGFPDPVDVPPPDRIDEHPVRILNPPLFCGILPHLKVNPDPPGPKVAGDAGLRDLRDLPPQEAGPECDSFTFGKVRFPTQVGIFIIKSL
jgi:hypothetical protein